MARASLTYRQKHELVAYAKAHPHLRQQDLVSWVLAEFGKTVGRSTVTRIVSAPPIPLNMNARRQRQPLFPDMELLLLEFVQLHQALCRSERFHPLGKSERASPPTRNLVFVGPEVQAALQYSAPQCAWRVGVGGSRYGRNQAPRAPDAARRVRGTGRVQFRRDRPLLSHAAKSVPRYKQNPCNQEGQGAYHGRSLLQHGWHGEDGACHHPQQQTASLLPRVNTDRLGILYFANTKSWMARVVFLKWLHWSNLKMHDRKVLLLVDNASSHESIELANVRVCFLPPNTTSFLQPLDAGIIKSFKCKYKKLLVRWVIDQLEADGNVSRMDVLTAIKFAVDAWASVSENTMRNSWCHTGIVPAPMAALLKSSNDCVDPGDLRELSALIRHLDLADPLDADAYVEIEDAHHGGIAETSEMPSDSDTEDHASEDDERAFSHREALVACQQLAVYAFAQEQIGREIAAIMGHAREMLLKGLKQPKISSFFTTENSDEME